LTYATNKISIQKQLLQPAIDAAREAGKAILEVYGSDFAVEQKDDKSPLTLADKKAHEIIAGRLSTLEPSLPILSEEGRDIPYEERRNWEYFWLVDPLDGTKEFIKRNGEFTVNIALIHRDRPVLGVVFAPVMNALYCGFEGGGAFSEKNGVRVKLPLQADRERYTIVGSRSHAAPEQDAFIAEMRKKHGEAEFISAGSSLKFCIVAEGRADVYPRFGPTMEWDTAAGQALVEQAGGRVVQMDIGAPVRYNKANLLNPWFMVTG
jgi:3'(2'), 5'-bisphosphate nucleotidase